MSECRLLEEQGRSHFMTRRFDRHENGDKIHMQSLYALAHLDNQLAGAHSYEQAFDVMQRLGLPASSMDEMYRRMLFNVIARNQDDHTKNIAFLMDKDGRWRLAPAFDVIYAYNPDGAWTSRHQMSVNGQRETISRADLLAVAERFRVRHADDAIDAVVTTVRSWPEYAAAAGLGDEVTEKIAEQHRSMEH